MREKIKCGRRRGAAAAARNKNNVGGNDAVYVCSFADYVLI